MIVQNYNAYTLKKPQINCSKGNTGSRENVSFGTDKWQLSPHIAKFVDADIKRAMEAENQALALGSDADRLPQIDYKSISPAEFTEVLDKQTTVCTASDCRRKLAADAIDEYGLNDWSKKFEAMLKNLQIHHHEDKDRSILEVAKVIGTDVCGFNPSRAKCKTDISHNGKWVTKVTDELFPGCDVIVALMAFGQPSPLDSRSFYIIDGRFSRNGQEVYGN